MEPRRQARSFLRGLLADIDTRSCWQLAEEAGDPSPHRMQRLLAEMVWDADAVRDDLRQYVTDELGDPQAVLVIDDTAGRVENAQVAVYLGYAAPGGYALIDRAVHLPRG